MAGTVPDDLARVRGKIDACEAQLKDTRDAFAKLPEGHSERALFLFLERLAAQEKRLATLTDQEQLFLMQQAPATVAVLPAANQQLAIQQGALSEHVQGVHVTFTVPSQLLRTTLPAAGTSSSAAPQEAVDFKSYAPLRIDLKDADEACARLGWEFIKNRQAVVDAALVSTVPTDLPRVKWVEREDDTANKKPAAEALKKALCLPAFMAIAEIERTIIAQYEEQRANKKTKVTAKSDFAVVYGKVLGSVQISPKDWLDGIFLLLDTKTTYAITSKLDKSRAAAALECLAANLALAHNASEKTSVATQRPPGGLPVLMTDVNSRCYGYTAAAGQQQVTEIWFNTRLEGFGYFSAFLQGIAEPVELLHFLPAHQHGPGPGGSGPGPGGSGTDGSHEHNAAQDPRSLAAQPSDAQNTSTGMPSEVDQQEQPQPSSSDAELLEAEVVDAGRNICSQLGVDASEPQVAEVYVESWEHALLRARFGNEVAAASTHGNKFMRVPSALAGLYV